MDKELGSRILGAVLSGKSPQEAVEAHQQEKQEGMVNSAHLPTEVHLPMFADPLGLLHIWGIRFTNNKEVGLLREAILPPGWKKVADPKEGKLSYLCDGNGRRRARIFYKNSGYDEVRASMIIVPRFELECNWWSDLLKSGKIVVRVMDGGVTELHRVEVDGSNLSVPDRLGLRQEAQEEAARWLGARYPYWQNPTQYWDQ